MKKRRSTTRPRIRAIWTFSLVLCSMLFMHVFTYNASACEPDCGPCMHWDRDEGENGECVLNTGATCSQDSECGTCGECGGSPCVCSADELLCDSDPGCETCNTDGPDTFDCEDDESLCDYLDCHYCQDGQCVDECSDPNLPLCDTVSDQCVECVDDPNCKDYEYCHPTYHSCWCNDCYAWDDIPVNYLPACPECDNDEGGCYDSYIWIQEMYETWTGGFPSAGEIGFCENPTTTEEVAHHIFCTDYQTDVEAAKQKIAELVALGLDLLLYLNCANCMATNSPSACFKCIKGLIEEALIDDEPCDWVDGCENCHDWDENCSFPIEEVVVDWATIASEDIPVCSEGTNW